MRLLLVVTLATVIGPCSVTPSRSEPTPTPSVSPTPWPKPDAKWMGPSQWVREGSEKYILVCGQSGKIIAGVVSSAYDDEWKVFGGDDNTYGEYVTLEQAKAKAEAVVVDPGLRHQLLHCP